MEDNEHVITDSATGIHVIDLTNVEDSPLYLNTIRHRRRRNIKKNTSANRNASINIIETTSPVIHRENMQRNNSRDGTGERGSVVCTDKIINLDDTIDKDESDTHYSIKSDNEKIVSLTCPICFEPLSSKMKPTATRCGHLFCAECVKESLRMFKKCPTCNATVTLRSCTRLFI